MKKMKVIVAIVLTIIMVTPVQFNYFTFVAEAHSGRTDSRGGHRDTKNKSGLGYYHYHCGGHPAHLHTGGVCPYASTSTSSSAYSNGNGRSNTSSSNDTIQVQTMQENNTLEQVEIVSDILYDNVAFNAEYYANKYEDLYEAYGNDDKLLYEHFITCGIYEGRQASEQFSIFVYKENNQDLIEAFGDDLIKYYNHFIEFGVNENRISK